MPLPTQPFRDEHVELIKHVEHIAQAAREVPRLSIDERREIVGRILGSFAAR